MPPAPTRRRYLPFIAAALLCCPPSLSAQSTLFRLPTYPPSEPPPARTASEVAALLAGAPSSAADTISLRVVLVAGPKDHGVGEHDYPAWQEVWSRLLAEAPLTQVETAWEFPTDEQMSRADVAVFYQRGTWNEARAQAVDAFLKRGGGLVYIHWAVDGRGGQEEMAKRIGLASLGGSIRYRHGPLEIDFETAEDHPIARNFSKIRWVDESYWMLTGDASRIHVLGSSLEDGEPRPQFWALDHQPGRVFVSIPGHYMWTFDDPAFRTLLLRGIAWTGQRSVDRFNSLVSRDARIMPHP